VKREVLIPHSYPTTKRLKNSRILGGAYASDTSAIIRSRKIKYLYIYIKKMASIYWCARQLQVGLGAVMVKCQRIQERAWEL
jgi:hypothetical protein